MLQCNMWMFDVFRIRAWSWANLVLSFSFVFSKCCYKLVYAIKDFDYETLEIFNIDVKCSVSVNLRIFPVIVPKHLKKIVPIVWQATET